MFSLVIHFPSRSFHFFLFRSKIKKILRSCPNPLCPTCWYVPFPKTFSFKETMGSKWFQTVSKWSLESLSTKDSVFSCYARFISTEFGITRIFQREHRSYQKKNGTCIITIHNVRFDIFMVVRWFQRVEVFRTEVSGNGAWEWFQTVSDPLE